MFMPLRCKKNIENDKMASAEATKVYSNVIFHRDIICLGRVIFQDAPMLRWYIYVDQMIPVLPSAY